MPSQSVAVQTDNRTSQPVAPPPNSVPAAKAEKVIKVTGKVRTAIDAMVWEGLPRKQAAAKADISEHGLYKAMMKPPVKAYYLAQCEVLRTSGRARRIHRLEEMLEQNENKAAVINAALALDRMGSDEAVTRGTAAPPGLVIQINMGGKPSFKPTDDERDTAISTTYTSNGAHGP